MLLLWVIQSGLCPAIALSQSLPTSLPTPSQPFPATPLPGQPTVPAQPASPTRRLLEDARQRLIDRGEIPDAAQPNGAPAQPVANPFEVYRLGPGDTLYINVLRFPDLSFQGTIDLEGNLLLPLAGAVQLKGLTPGQAREQIRIALDRFVVNPQVDVILIAQRPVQVAILGEVARPGVYPLQAPQLSVALVSAGGATRLADLRTVRIRRTLGDGSLVDQDVDLFTPLRDAQSVPDLRLEDGDTVVVPTLTAENSAGYDRDLIARSNLAQAQVKIRVLNYATAGRGGTVGSLQLPNGSSFVDALTAISPDLSSADLRHIALIRFDVQQGKAVTQELDGKHAITGDMSQNPILEENDVIVIGRNLVSRITYALNTFTQPFRDILGFLLFFDSLANSADNLFKPSGNSR
ncbi:MAG TPA: polysaccharide biosynthesis/export family protein [Coleofasciculaceae cyanobacterium]